MKSPRILHKPRNISAPSFNIPLQRIVESLSFDPVPAANDITDSSFQVIYLLQYVQTSFHFPRNSSSYNSFLTVYTLISKLAVNLEGL